MNPLSPPVTEIAGHKLTVEQTSYLEGWFAGLRNRGFAFSDVAPNPAAEPSRAHLEDLIPEERIKRELHPLDAYPLLLQHAAANQAPDRENLFRFKWQGLFFLTPNKEAFMARLRIPGGELKSFQLREIARIARELTTGYIQITTRANLQIRLIEPRNAPEVLRRIQGVGLHTRGAGADNIRNLTCDPASGLDPAELVETLPLVRELGQMILNHREFYDLPRKFNIAVHGGGAISSVEDTNDIGWRAVRVFARGSSASPPCSDDHISNGLTPGVYFRCALGGATGHKGFASDLDVLVRPEDLVKATSALIRVYLNNGNRTDRKKARLKHLLDTWSLDRYREETERLLGRPFLRLSKEASPIVDSAHPTPQPHPHVGVFAQKQAGLNWIGVFVPVGQLTIRQLERLAELAELYGSGDLRLTVWQSLVLPNIPDAYVETVKKALTRLGFDWRQSNLRSGFVACTGNSYCKFASTNTKAHALNLMDYLDRKLQLDTPVNIHLTGCPNSCAQHYIGDIGLLGTKVKVEGETLEGYHVFVGGGFGDRAAIGRQLFSSVSVRQIQTTIERMLTNFLKCRREKETFHSFAGRHELGRLQELLGAEG